MSEIDLDPCRCCAGTSAETPARIDNPPGQSAVAYRAGVHAHFKESLLARLASAQLPALERLTTRADGDLTIALCDALATALDVLTFYQERIANENFLRTATERRSVLELAQLIGYQLAPGVAAGTHLAFTLQDVPGSPALAAGPVLIPIGTRVQSVPGQDEQAQTFETVEVTEARAEWNAIPVQASRAWQPRAGDTSLWLAGLSQNVQAGDVILLVGEERLTFAGSERWDARVITHVREDRAQQRVEVAWDTPLGHTHPAVQPAALGVKVYVFRQRAGLFGHNAPDPRLMSAGDSQLPTLVDGVAGGMRWKDARFAIQGSGTSVEIDLDAAYAKITPGSWFALVSNEATAHASGLAGYVELYRAVTVSFPSRSDFGLSGKVTRLRPDTDENIGIFRKRLREDLVLAQSEELAVAPTPLAFPLYGKDLALDRLAPGIAPGIALALSGKRARIALRAGQPDVTMVRADGSSAVVAEGDALRLLAPPERMTGGVAQTLSPAQFGALLRARAGVTLRLHVLDRDGRAGQLTAAAAAFELTVAAADDDEVHEIAFVDARPTAVTEDRDRTTLTLADALQHCYDRDSARVTANVVRATHGETVREILGGADARVADARFALRQAPLTYVSAPTASGRRSTLQVRANDLLWDEVATLFARGPADRVYEARIDDEARCTIRFGDGEEGARLPSGDHNVRAVYRKGIGAAGNVAAGKLTTLLSRPLGVTGASNPEAASGGEDPERTAKARANAPLTVTTLERAVSIRDYQDYARGFAGIAKAHALWVHSGPARGVFLTIAGEGGAAVPPASGTYKNLLRSLRDHGDALLPLRLASYRDVRFHTRIAVQIAADADADLVLPALDARLRAAFAFDARAFGQGVSVDEVAAVAHGVPGIVAAHVTELHRSTAPLPAFVPRLFAATPLASLTELPSAAELLTLEASGPVVERIA